MTHNHYIYIAVMALVSYAIRILPLTLIRKPIKKSLHSVVSVLCALCDAGGHDLPGHCQRDPEPGCRCHGAGGRHCSCLVRRKPVSGICGLLCRRVRAGTVPFKTFCVPRAGLSCCWARFFHCPYRRKLSCKKILITGAGGFVGSRILQQWQGKYELCALPKGLFLYSR